MRQRIKQRGVDREHRIEEMCKPDPVSFGHQPEEAAVTVETPRPALFDDIQAWLIMTEKEPIRHAAGWVFIG